MAIFPPGVSEAYAERLLPMVELYMLCSRCQLLFLFLAGHHDNWLI
jgi:hypothetical protein